MLMDKLQVKVNLLASCNFEHRNIEFHARQNIVNHCPLWLKNCAVVAYELQLKYSFLFNEQLSWFTLTLFSQTEKNGAAESGLLSYLKSPQTIAKKILSHFHGNNSKKSE